MSFKVHLIIVSVIIIAVYLAWGATRTKPAPATVQAITGSDYSITVNHASWGLNCPQTFNENALDKAYAAKTPETRKPRRDNALAIVGSLCNGKPSCDIQLSDALFKDMAPENCGEKKLEIEYRCFAFDRPWHKQATSGILSIDCSDQVSQ